MNISRLLSSFAHKRSVCILAGLASVIAISAFAVSAKDSLRGLHDPLKQPAAIQDLTRSQPVIGIARAGDSLVSVGLRGLIMISTDGGESWKQAPSPVASDLIQVRFQDELNGWIVGHDSVLLATTDGGLSWELRLDGRSLVALLKEHYSSDIGLDEFEAESMLREIDLATSTSADPDVMATPFLDVFVNQNGEGFLIGAFGMLLHTTDNGVTWEPWIERSENERRMHLYGIDMYGDQAYISGEQGLLMRLDREAERFLQVETPYTGTFFGVYARRDLLLAYGLRGNLYVSRDEGDNWTRVDTQQQATLVDALEDGPNHALLVSQRGELIRLDNRSLETTRLAVPFTGEVYSSAKLDGSGGLVVTQFSGVRRIDISQYQ